MEGGGGREERKKIGGFAGKRFLHSPPPPPSFLFLLSFQFSRRTRAEPLATQARAETVHGTLRFLYLSHLLYGICVKIFIMNRYISKSYTTSKNTID